MMLMAITGVAFLLLNVDRWLAAATLNTSAFAAYSFAWTLPLVAQQAQQIINTSVFPTMARSFVSGNARSAFRICAASSLLILMGGAISILPGFWVLKYCVHHWFPKYVDAIVIMPLFFGVAILRVSDYWSSFLLVARREGSLLLANIATLITGLLVWDLFIYSRATAPLQPADVALLPVILSALSYATVTGCALVVRLGQGGAQIRS
jgi:O-antigen/teichoic acid export membrane protein